jgi:hypothetical protein
MKKTFLNLSLFTTAMLISNSAFAYKFVIYTDEAVTNKSEQVAEIMKTTYPLNKFDIEVEIVRVPASDLECASAHGIDRLVTCENLDSIQAKAARLGGDQAMIVKNIPKWGGSSGVGGGVPVITTSTSPRAMLHEFMHTLGLCDEYEYVESEANFYCVRETDKPNITFITPLSGYSGDSHARTEHGANIPWFKDILSTTPITNMEGARLGTGMVNFNKVEPKNNTKEAQMLGEQTGLYQGKVCNKATPARASWQPGGGATIMENTEAGLGAPLERIVEKIMASKGARKKMQLEEPKESPRGDNDAGKITVTPETEVEVNNTGRSFFKSFLDWLKDLFQTISNGFPR